MTADVILVPQSATTATDRSVPEPGQVVEVRGSTWAVAWVRVQGLPRSPADEAVAALNHAVTLQAMDEDRLGEELTVVWELEVGHTVTPAQGLPTHINPDAFDDPNTLAGFVDAMRWGRSPQRTTAACRRRSTAVLRSRHTSWSRCAGRSPRPGRTCCSLTTSASARRSRSFEVKTNSYFTGPGGVSPFALTTQVLRQDAWTPDLLRRRQAELLSRLAELWRLRPVPSAHFVAVGDRSSRGRGVSAGCDSNAGRLRAHPDTWPPAHDPSTGKDDTPGGAGIRSLPVQTKRAVVTASSPSPVISWWMLMPLSSA